MAFKIEENKLHLRVPSGTYSVELGCIGEVQRRLFEVALCSSTTAPELMAVYNEAWGDAQDVVRFLKEHHDMAEIEAKSVRGRVLLDVVPGELERRGLVSPRSPSGSEDLRNAVIDTNADYIAAQKLVVLLEGLLEAYRTKARRFENAYTGVKKILGDLRELPLSPSRSTDAAPGIMTRAVTGAACSVCGLPQFKTTSGDSCPNGHGGAEPLEQAVERQTEEGWGAPRYKD